MPAQLLHCPLSWCSEPSPCRCTCTHLHNSGRPLTPVDPEDGSSLFVRKFWLSPIRPNQLLLQPGGHTVPFASSTTQVLCTVHCVTLHSPSIYRPLNIFIEGNTCHGRCHNGAPHFSSTAKSHTFLQALLVYVKQPTALLAKDSHTFSPLNAELNPIRHLLALVGARHIVHVSRIWVKHT